MFLNTLGHLFPKNKPTKEVEEDKPLFILASAGLIFFLQYQRRNRPHDRSAKTRYGDVAINRIFIGL